MASWIVDVPGGMPVTPLPLGPSVRPAPGAVPEGGGQRTVCRTGSGAPAVLSADVEGSLYFDVDASELYVMRVSDGARVWTKAAGSSSGGGSSGGGGTVPSSVVEAITEAGDPGDLTVAQKDELLAKLIAYVAAKEGVS